MSKLVYVSWSDCGRRVCVEKSLAAAAAADKDLLFLAVLESEDFADLKKGQLLLAVDELKRLLVAQIYAAAKRNGFEDVSFEVVVRTADRGSNCEDLVDFNEDDQIMFDDSDALTGLAA